MNVIPAVSRTAGAWPRAGLVLLCLVCQAGQAEPPATPASTAPLTAPPTAPLTSPLTPAPTATASTSANPLGEPANQPATAAGVLLSPAGPGTRLPPFTAAAVATSRLAMQRGGSASSVVDQVGRVSDATASQVTTGHNAIRGGAFAHAAGLNTVIQNSGANVVIQNATTVNLQFK